MQKLILYGSEKSDSLRRYLLFSLKNKLNVSFMNSHIFQSRKKEALQLFEVDGMEKISADASILFLKTKADFESLRYLKDNMTVIINSANHQQLEFISKFKVNVVTCGLSTKDTITFSSRDENSAVVSLQRSIRAIDGTIIEPMDIPCKITKKYSDYFVLGYVAILLLLNLVSQNQGENITINYQT